MATLKIRKVGSSLGVIIPKEILHELHVKEGDSVSMIREEPAIYRVVPFDPTFAVQMESFNKGCRRYKNALKELSKK